MPAFGVRGPVGRAASVIRVPRVTKDVVVTTLREHCDLWKKILKEQAELQEKGEGDFWVKHKIDYGTIDFQIQSVIDATDKQIIFKDIELTPQTASEVLAATRANLRTCVLATVHCPAWFLTWQQSLALLILSSYMNCQQLILYTLMGGPQCVCEVLFILRLLRELGFVTTSEEPKVMKDWGVVQWRFKKAREGANECEVYVMSFFDMDHVTSSMFAQALRPSARHMHSPDLRRIAVVSAPVTLLGKPPRRMDEVLNIKLKEVLDGLEKIADELGCFWDDDFRSWDQKIKELDTKPSAGYPSS